MWHFQNVRKTPSWPRSWPNFSHLQLHFHRNALANLHILGKPNTPLAKAGFCPICLQNPECQACVDHEQLLADRISFRKRHAPLVAACLAQASLSLSADIHQFLHVLNNRSTAVIVCIFEHRLGRDGHVMADSPAARRASGCRWPSRRPSLGFGPPETLSGARENNIVYTNPLCKIFRIRTYHISYTYMYIMRALLPGATTSGSVDNI